MVGAEPGGVVVRGHNHAGAFATHGVNLFARDEVAVRVAGHPGRDDALLLRVRLVIFRGANAVLRVSVFVGGIVVGVRRSWRTPGEAGVTTAALTAAFAAYAFGLGFEWMWELPAVSVAGVASLALVTGPATAPLPEPRIAVAASPITRIPRLGFGLGIAALSVAWLLICAQAIPLLANREVARSQAAVRTSELATALKHANAARAIVA